MSTKTIIILVVIALVVLYLLGDSVVKGVTTSEGIAPRPSAKLALANPIPIERYNRIQLG